MFEFLKEINEKLYERYLTLERNIKAASNSFYDAYLDLQEEFIKLVAIELDITSDNRETCGQLLKREAMREDRLKLFLLKQIKNSFFPLREEGQNVNTEEVSKLFERVEVFDAVIDPSSDGSHIRTEFKSEFFLRTILRFFDKTF